MKYRIYLVPNGSRTVFFNGINNSKKPFADRNCRVWWSCDTKEDALAKFREFALEESMKEGRIDEIIELMETIPDPEVDYDAYTSEVEKAEEKFADKCVESRCIEWDNDLKWLRIAKCDDNGEIVEVL